MFVKAPEEFKIEVKKDGDQYTQRVEEWFEAWDETAAVRTKNTLEGILGATSQVELIECRAEDNHFILELKTREKEVLINNIVGGLIEHSTLAEMTIVELLWMIIEGKTPMDKSR